MFNSVRTDTVRISAELSLGIVGNAVNDPAGEEGLKQTLLVAAVKPLLSFSLQKFQI